MNISRLARKVNFIITPTPPRTSQPGQPSSPQPAEMEVLDRTAPVNNNVGRDEGILLSDLRIIGTMIWFPFAAVWWISTTLITFPWTIASWLMTSSVWAVSLPFMIISRLVQLVLAPFRYLWWLLCLPWPRSWSLTGVIDTIGPIPTCILIAGIVGIMAGVVTYGIAFSLSFLTSTALAERPPSKFSSKEDTSNKISRLKGSGGRERGTDDTPCYDSDSLNGAEIPFFFDNNSSRRSSFVDFDTDDATTIQQTSAAATAVLLQHRTATGKQQQRGSGSSSGLDLYAAWRERVEGNRSSSGGSGTDGILRSPPVLLSPVVGAAGSGSSKRRLPGLLFGTTIHEEDDDSL